MKYTLFETRHGFLDTDTIKWLGENKGPASVDIAPVQIRVFKHMLNKYSTYTEIPIQEFWDFLMDLMLVFTDLKEPPEEYTDIGVELQGIKNVLMWWIYTEGHEIKIDHTLWNVERKSVNHLFRTKACHVWSIIQDRASMLSVYNSGVQIKRSKPEVIDELFRMIRESCMGDSDEMVVYCMDYIKRKVITNHHVKLANITRLVYDPNSSTEDCPLEAWRVLFPKFFDESGKSFQTFSAAFLNYCILFFMEDYLQLKTDHIQVVPFTYPNYIVKGPDGTLAADVLYFYGIDFFKDRVNVIKRLSEAS